MITAMVKTGQQAQGQPPASAPQSARSGHSSRAASAPTGALPARYWGLESWMHKQLCPDRSDGSQEASSVKSPAVNIPGSAGHALWATIARPHAGGRSAHLSNVAARQRDYESGQWLRADGWTS